MEERVSRRELGRVALVAAGMALVGRVGAVGTAQTATIDEEDLRDLDRLLAQPVPEARRGAVKTALQGVANVSRARTFSPVPADTEPGTVYIPTFPKRSKR